MTTYTVTDNTGKTITRGDTITDFRGNTHIFYSVTRGTEYNGIAKISTGSDAYGREYYANVFNLTVTTNSTQYVHAGFESGAL